MTHHHTKKPDEKRTFRVALGVFAAVLSLAIVAPVALALGPPIISGTSVTHVTDTSATFQATVNPNGRKTTYYFQYIPLSTWQQQDGEQFGEGTLTTHATVIEAELGADHPVSAVLSGLSPATAYRFRLFAQNVQVPEGLTGEELGFTTFSTSSEPGGSCPNAEFRHGPSAHLPDCRAYEQATPREKNGSDVTGTLFSVQASLSGDAITSYTHPGIPGGSGFQSLPAYVSRRVGGSWSTEGLLPPAAYGDQARVQAWTPDLALSLSTAALSPEVEKGTWLMRQSTDGSITTLAPYTTGDYAFAGASANDSKLFLESSAALAPGGIAGKPNLYRYDRATGATTLVSALPDSACGSPPCAPANGAFAGPYGWWTGDEAEGGASAGYLTQEERAISANGDSAYFTEDGTGKLYLRRGLGGPTPTTIHVNATEKTNGAGGGPDPHGPAPAAFQIASVDGKTAYFTSTEKLTNDANTGPEAEGPKIGRAKLNGEAPASEENPSYLAAKGIGTAVDGEYLYWANPSDHTISRAKISASGPVEEPTFIVPGETCFETHPVSEPGAIHCAPSTPRYVTVRGEYIYWTNTGPLGGDAGTVGTVVPVEVPIQGAGTIGRAKIGTSGDLVPGSVEPEFIAGAANPQGIAVNSEHIYWANSVDGLCTGGGCLEHQESIGRAGIEGEAVEELFYDLHPPGSSASGLLYGVTLDAEYIYWTEQSGGRYSQVRRIPLEGTEEKNSGIFVGEDVSGARGIVIAGSYLYWVFQGKEEIGRIPLADFTYNSDCKDIVTCEPEFIKLSGGPIGVATDSSEEHLYWSTNGETPPNPGNDLYRFEAEKPAGERLTDLTPDTSDEDGAEAAGVLGASEDGSRVYFVANGVLAANEGALGSHASHGNCARREGSGSGTCNLYLYHGGEVTYVAQLSGSVDAPDWVPNGRDGTNNTRQSEARVSPDGGTLLFSSVLSQTAYDNHGIRELYRYEAAGGGGRIDCVSCPPTDLPPANAPVLKQGDQNHTGSSLNTFNAQPFLSRNLSIGGGRVFFQSAEKLVAADVNGEGGCKEDLARGAGPSCTDVYEWEAPGEGSCSEESSAYVPADGGCLYLLSTGTSAFPSYLGDVSANGDVAFIFTRDQLVPSDEDNLQDIYAVTADGGLASQHTATPPSCGSAAECRGAGTSVPSQSGAGSASFSGPGNKKQPHLRDCDPAAERAQKLTQRSKQLRRQAKHAQSPGEARRLRHESAQFGKRAHSLSGDAKRCRNANRKASR